MGEMSEMKWNRDEILTHRDEPDRRAPFEPPGLPRGANTDGVWEAHGGELMTVAGQ